MLVIFFRTKSSTAANITRSTVSTLALCLVSPFLLRKYCKLLLINLKYSNYVEHIPRGTGSRVIKQSFARLQCPPPTRGKTPRGAESEHPVDKVRGALAVEYIKSLHYAIAAHLRRADVALKLKAEGSAVCSMDLLSDKSKSRCWSTLFFCTADSPKL